MTLAVLITTVASEADARGLASTMVAEKLAACVQILKVDSIYDWDGLQNELEWRLEMKTTEAVLPRLMERVAAIHPYEEPELIAVPVILASAGYTEWIVGSVQAAGEDGQQMAASEPGN